MGVVPCLLRFSFHQLCTRINVANQCPTHQHHMFSFCIRSERKMSTSQQRRQQLGPCIDVGSIFSKMSKIHSSAKISRIQLTQRCKSCRQHMSTTHNRGVST